MFDWMGAREAVRAGCASPLSVVSALEQLTDDELLMLEPADALAVVELVQAATSALSAVSALGMEALTRREADQRAREQEDRRRRGERVPPGLLADEAAATTLAPALCVSPRTMGARLGEVRMLVNELPLTFALVRAGRLDLHRAGAVAAEGQLVRPELRPLFDEAITAAPKGRRKIPLTDLTSMGVHRRGAADAVRVDPESAAARAAAAIRDRFVRVAPGTEPGVTAWSASLPSDGSLKAWAAVDALASQYASDDPSKRIDQARADALIALILAQAEIHTTVELVVPLDPAAAWRSETDSGCTGCNGHAAAGSGPTSSAPSEPPPTSPTSRRPASESPDSTGLETAPPDPAPDGASSGSVTTAAHEDPTPTHSRSMAPHHRRRWTRRSALERHLRLVVLPEALARARMEQTAVDPTASLLQEPPSEEDRDPGLPDCLLDDLGPEQHDAHNQHDAHDAHGHLESHREQRATVRLERLDGPSGEYPREASALTLGAVPPPSPTASGVTPRCEVGVRHPRVGIILNSAVSAWLADPDTRIRLHGCDLSSGALVVHDPTVYRPSARLARIVRARDGHCRFPGCATDAARTQLDHVVPFPLGPTTLGNLICLCTKHHSFKHGSGWTLDVGDDATCTWRTPLGRVYVTKPRVVEELVA